MMNQLPVGIDLGTSTSGIAVYRNNQAEVIKIDDNASSP